MVTMKHVNMLYVSILSASLELNVIELGGEMQVGFVTDFLGV